MLSSVLAFQRSTSPLPSLPRLAVRTLVSMAASAEDATKVLCAERSSVGVAVEEGKTYSWCTCGRSNKQPFCDGSHAGTEFRSMVPQLQIFIWVWAACRNSLLPSRRRSRCVAASSRRMLPFVMEPTKRCPRTPRTSSSLRIASHNVTTWDSERFVSRGIFSSMWLRLVSLCWRNSRHMWFVSSSTVL